MRTITDLHKELNRVLTYNGYHVPEYGCMNKAEIVDLLLDEILLTSNMCAL